MKRALSALVICACAGPSPSPPTLNAPDAARAAGVTALVGEVHLHEFPAGGHAWASFVRDPVPLASALGGTLTEIDPAVTSVAGACALYVLPSCAACAASEYCLARDRCATLPEFHYVGAGAVAVTGSTVVPLIRIWPEGTDGAYVADPAPGAQRLFAGGETLAFRGGDGANAFVAELPAPGPVEVLAPDLVTDLRVPLDGAMDVRWAPPASDEVVVRVLVSSASASAWIRCDTASATAITIPAELIASLPPPPRTTRLEVERIEQRVVPTARAGLGVLVHAAQTTWKNGND